MTESRVPAALDALVALWTALEDLTVYDGPVVTGAEPAKRVFVGYDGDPDSDFTAAAGDQDFAGTLGTARRDEAFVIPCCVLVLNGAGDIKQARTDAYAEFGKLSAALRGDVSLGFPAPSTAQTQNLRLHQYPTSSGVEARIAFDVAVKTRI